MRDTGKPSPQHSRPRPGWDRWLHRLGWLLPARLREYVFEPACYDLVQDTLERRRGARLLVPSFFAILIQVSAFNFPRVLFDHRRPSRLAFLLGWLALASLLALIALAMMLRSSYEV